MSFNASCVGAVPPDAIQGQVLQPKEALGLLQCNAQCVWQRLAALLSQYFSDFL